MPASIACSGPPRPWREANERIGYHGWLSRYVGQPGPIDPARLREARAVYYGLISEIDHQLGRVLHTLARRDLLERTLIVVTSDHGEMLGDHGMLGKSGFFSQAFRVPLILRAPGAGRPRHLLVRDLTEHGDVLPTLVEAAGGEVPPQCDGYSLSAHLTGERRALGARRLPSSTVSAIR